MKVFFPAAYYYPETCAGLYILDNVMERCAEEGIESVLTVPTPTRDVDPNMVWKRHE